MDVCPSIGVPSEEQPHPFLFAEISDNGRTASSPFLKQSTIVGERFPDQPIPAYRHAIIQCAEELRSVPLQASSIHHPNQFRVEGLARATFFRLNARVLELNYPTIRGLHICDVSFPIFGVVNDFLPISRKVILPCTVPRCLVLPPRIAELLSLVSPVRKPDLSALRDHRVAAARTLPRKTGLSLLTFSIH
jgi:hypothetical protein